LIFDENKVEDIADIGLNNNEFAEVD